MKKLYSILIVCFCLYGLISCHCKKCTDNIIEANKKIPYKNNELIAFTNDTLGVVYDTVSVSFGRISSARYGCYGSSGDAEQKYCTTFSEMTFSNYFNIKIIQAPNSGDNKIYYSAIPNHGEKSENVSYVYKNEIITAIRFYTPIDTFGSQIWTRYKFKNGDSTFIYNDYYYITDRNVKLLQYTRVYKDGKRRVFKLTE